MWIPHILFRGLISHQSYQTFLTWLLFNSPVQREVKTTRLNESIMLFNGIFLSERASHWTNYRWGHVKFNYCIKADNRGCLCKVGRCGWTFLLHFCPKDLLPYPQCIWAVKCKWRKSHLCAITEVPTWHRPTPSTPFAKRRNHVAFQYT